MGIDVLSQFCASAALPLADAGLLIVFLFAAGVTAMTFAGFTMWVAYHAIRVLVLLVGRLVLMPRRKQCSWHRSPPAHASWLACADPVCRTSNPEHARFCRHCGRMMRRSTHLAA
jgi:hypothetical protein